MLPFRLRDLALGVRLGLSLLVLVLFGGLLYSATHLVQHHEGRDGTDGFSYDDVVGVYHGIRTEAPLAVALESGHPEELGDAERQVLLDWLASGDLAGGYDSLELGDSAPAEIVDANCLQCHASGATEGNGVGERLPLEYFDEVEALAVSRDVAPQDPEIVIASAHTHALGMGSLSIVLLALALATRFGSRLVGLCAVASGAGLLADLGSWLLARDSVGFVVLIAGGGTLWMVANAVLALLVLGELWLPRRGGATE